MSREPKDQNPTVLFFDGECGLCDNAVQQIMKRDKTEIFRYSALQGQYAKVHLDQKFIKDLNSMILIHNGEIHTQSSAFVKILELLGDHKTLTFLFKKIPTSLRNYLYQLVARNRHRFFKSKQACQFIDAERRKKLFLD